MPSTIRIVVILLLLSAALPAAAPRYFIQAEAHLWFSADSRFADLYGKGKINPGLRAGLHVSENWFIWADAGVVSASATPEEVGESISAKQISFGGGIGYERRIDEAWSWQAFLGIQHWTAKETALGESVSDSVLGMEVGAGVRRLLGGNLYAAAMLSYGRGNATFNTLPLKTGGFRLGAGIGLRF